MSERINQEELRRAELNLTKISRDKNGVRTIRSPHFDKQGCLTEYAVWTEHVQNGRLEASLPWIDIIAS